jgi:hypothetical protein
MIRYIIIIAVSLMILLSGCYAAKVVKKEEIPVYPLKILKQYDKGVFYKEGAISILIPLHLDDKQLRILRYNADGLLSQQAFDDITFPVQIWMIYNEPNVQVFLVRAPDSACPLQWHKEDEQFYDGCLGTKYARDGQYLDGPPTRALDELPVRIQGDMIWVSNQIIYGELTAQYDQ